jgi:hypothetical protein
VDCAILLEYELLAVYDDEYLDILQEMQETFPRSLETLVLDNISIGSIGCKLRKFLAIMKQASLDDP